MLAAVFRKLGSQRAPHLMTSKDLQRSGPKLIETPKLNHTSLRTRPLQLWQLEGRFSVFRRTMTSETYFAKTRKQPFCMLNLLMPTATSSKNVGLQDCTQRLDWDHKLTPIGFEGGFCNLRQTDTMAWNSGWQPDERAKTPSRATVPVLILLLLLLLRVERPTSRRSYRGLKAVTNSFISSQQSS